MNLRVLPSIFLRVELGFGGRSLVDFEVRIRTALHRIRFTEPVQECTNLLCTVISPDDSLCLPICSVDADCPVASALECVSGVCQPKRSGI